MKTVAIIGILMFSIALAQCDKTEMIAKWTKNILECKTEEGASDDDMMPFVTHEEFKSQKSKCVLACINDKMGYSKDAYPIHDKVMEMAAYYGDSAKAKVWDEATSQCADLKSPDRCERAWEFVSCIYHNIMNRGLNPIEYFV